MFNTFTYNLKPFNVSEPSSTEFSDILEYNGYTMSANGQNLRLVNIRQIQSSGSIEKQVFDIANSHGMGLNNYFFKQKTIEVEAVLRADTKEELDSVIDSLTQALAQENKTLKFKKDSGDIVTTTAYCDSWEIDRKGWNITFAPVTMIFRTVEPFFYGLSTNEAAFTGQSSNLSSSVSNPSGTYKAYPEINITFLTGLSGVTQVEVTLGDKTITVNENISDNDVLVIDGKDQDVRLNSIGGQDYTGRFPTLDIGTNTFEVTINGTWSADIYVNWSYTYV